MLHARVSRLCYIRVMMILLSPILEQRVRRPNQSLFVISESIVAVAIQNTTFGGIQGFTRKPSTPWKTESGKFAGVVHQERGWTYVLLYGTGHLVPRDDPELVRSYFSHPLFVRIGHSRLGLCFSA